MTQFAGDTFVLDSPAGVPAVWGAGHDVFWAKGEPLIVVAGDGTGKTTVAGQLVRARIGVRDSFLDLPVEPGGGVLYLACDRPRQIQRSFRRMFDEAHRSILHSRIAFWKGPLPFDVVSDPDLLLEMVEKFEGVDTLVVDSLKDIAVRLSEDETGSAVNHALQKVIAADVEVLVLHHQRKGVAGDRKIKDISDVYGSRWLTAGMGSVIALIGEPGDALVELRHLKQPADAVGPFTLVHDHDKGETSLHERVDPVDFIRRSAATGRTVKEVAEVIEGTTDPDRNAIERTRRKLSKLVAQQTIIEWPASSPGGATTYVFNGGAA